MADYNLGTASGRIQVDGRGAAIGFQVAQAAAGGFFQVVDAKVRSIQNLGRSMVAVGAAGTVGFGVAIKTAADFQQQMSGVQAVANATESQYESLRKKALQLGADTVYSASEAANAIEELVKAGIPVEDVLNGAADAAVALAAAGGVSIPEAATIAANAMNSFEMSASDVADIADVLAGVANTSAADVSGIGQSLQQAGAVAHLAGLSFRDTAIAIGEMADAGIKGSDAGTSIKTMMNNLIPTTQKQITEFERLHLLTFNNEKAMQTLRENGIAPLGKDTDTLWKQFDKLGAALSDSEPGSAKAAKAAQTLAMRTGALSNAFFDEQGNVKNLAGLQGTLGKALSGMNRQQKLSTLELLFGADAMRASAIMSLQGKKGYEEFSKAVSKTKASDVAKKRLDNLAGAVEQFKGSLQTAQITIGSIFLPIITKLFNLGTKLLNFFNALPKPVQIAIGVIAALATAGALLLGVILAFLPAILGMIANFLLLRSLKIVVGSFRAVWAAIKAGEGVMAASQLGAARLQTGFTTLGKRTFTSANLMLKAAKLMRLVWITMTGPIGIAILAVVALISIGVVLYKKWKPFRDLVDMIARKMVDGFNAAKAVLMPFLQKGVQLLQAFGNYIANTLLPVLREFAGKILGALIAQWDKVKQAIAQNLMPALRELAAVFTGSIVPAFQGLMRVASPVAKVIGGALAVALFAAYKAISFVVQILVTKLIPIFLKIYGTYLVLVIQQFGNLLVGVIKVITGIVNILTGSIKIFKGIFTGDWGLVLEGAKQVLKGFFQAITSMFVAGLKLPLKLVVKFGKFLGSLFSKAFSALFGGGDGGGGVLSPLVNGFKTGLNFIVGIVKAWFNLMLAPWKAFWGVFGGVISAFFGLFVAIVKLAWIIIKGVFLMTLGIIWNIVKSTFTNIWNVIKWAVGLIMKFLRAEWRGLVRIFGPPLRFIIGIVRSVFNRMKSIISGVINTVVGFLKTRLTNIKNNFTTAWNAVKNVVSKAWDRIKTAVKTGIDKIVSFAKGLKSKIVDPILGIGEALFRAGAAIFQKLLDGITSKVQAITDKVDSVAHKVKGFFGGSPVEEGPLVSWNNGAPGKHLMMLLAEGIDKNRRIAIRAAESTAGAMADALNKATVIDNPALLTVAGATGNRAVTPLSPATTGKNRVRKGGAGAKASQRSRMVDGELRLDESGRAFIRGIAEDVVDDADDYDDTVRRMR